MPCRAVCRGYIVDVSLKGTSVEPDGDDMEAAYGEGTTPADVLQVRSLGVSSTACACAIARRCDSWLAVYDCSSFMAIRLKAWALKHAVPCIHVKKEAEAVPQSD